MTNKVLTIVVPTYNMEKYLDRCLSSLIVDDQLMELLEVLVINDGSKDRSSEIAHTYESRYPQTFKVVDKQNGNYGSCINAALLLARGTYIKVLDADDYFEQSNFGGFISFLVDKEVDLVVTQTYQINNVNGGVCKFLFDGLSDSAIDFEKQGFAYLNDLNMHSIAYKTSLLRDCNYRQLEGISYTDIQWHSIPMMYVSSMQCYRKLIYNYIIGRDGQTVEDATHCRNIWMEEKVLMFLVSYLEEHKNNLKAGNLSAMYLRMRHHLLRLYSCYLLNNVEMLDEQNIVLFDQQLKIVSPRLFGMLNNGVAFTRFFEFKYIKNWRKNYSRKTTMYFLYDLYCKSKTILKG